MLDIELKNKFFIFVKNCGGGWNEKDKLLLKQQLKFGWDIGNTTPNRSVIQKGDKALLYISGKNAQIFVGEIELNSEVYAPTEKLRRKYFTLPLVMSSEYWVDVAKFSFWDDPIPIRKVLPKLSFVKNKNNFGVYLLGGVTHIPENDYNQVLKSIKTLKHK